MMPPNNGNGDGNVGIGWKTVTLAMLASLGVLAVGFASINERISEQTDDRYRAADALRDFQLRDYRMTRNEANIQLCLDHIRMVTDPK